METTIKISVIQALLIAGVVLMFSPGMANAQTQLKTGKRTRFAQCDQNRDGFIGQGECRAYSWANYDKNGDQLLSRKEYRQMNKDQKKLRDGTGAGQQMRNKAGNRPGNGQGQGLRQGNGRQNQQGQGQMRRGGKG